MRWVKWIWKLWPKVWLFLINLALLIFINSVFGNDICFVSCLITIFVWVIILLAPAFWRDFGDEITAYFEEWWNNKPQ